MCINNNLELILEPHKLVMKCYITNLVLELWSLCLLDGKIVKNILKVFSSFTISLFFEELVEIVFLDLPGEHLPQDLNKNLTSFYCIQIINFFFFGLFRWNLEQDEGIVCNQFQILPNISQSLISLLIKITLEL